MVSRGENRKHSFAFLFKKNSEQHGLSPCNGSAGVPALLGVYQSSVSIVLPLPEPEPGPLPSGDHGHERRMLLPDILCLARERNVTCTMCQYYVLKNTSCRKHFLRFASSGLKVVQEAFVVFERWGLCVGEGVCFTLFAYLHASGG